jgi:transcriptional regulator with XRE-family HTH domain
MAEETRLATFLREQARSRDMSQNEFARAVGVAPATLSAIRHGHTPTMDVIRQLAEALELPATDLAELAGIIDQRSELHDDVPPEVRVVLRRYSRLPAERQAALLRMFDQMISFAEAQVQ